MPLTLEDTGIGEAVCKKLKLRPRKPNLKAWRRGRQTSQQQITVRPDRGRDSR